MSAPTGRSGLTPGDCLQLLQQLNRWRDKGWRAVDLPRAQRDDLTDALEVMRTWASEDVHAVRPAAALLRITDTMTTNLGHVQKHDLQALKVWLMTITPTRRPR